MEQHSKDVDQCGGDSSGGWATCTCGAFFEAGNKGAAGYSLSVHVKASNKALVDAAWELVGFFEARRNESSIGGRDWLARAARHFADSDATTHFGMAVDLLLNPRMQDTAYNRSNGYTPYSTPSELWHRILRVSS